MNQENIDLAIKNVQSFILQNHRDLSGGEKLTKIVIERIEKSEEYFQDIATDEQREFIIKKVFSNLSRTMEDGVTLIDNDSFEPWYRDIKGEIKSIYWEDYKRHLKVNEDCNAFIDSFKRNSSNNYKAFKILIVLQKIQNYLWFKRFRIFI